MRDFARRTVAVTVGAIVLGCAGIVSAVAADMMQQPPPPEYYGEQEGYASSPHLLPTPIRRHPVTATTTRRLGSCSCRHHSFMGDPTTAEALVMGSGGTGTAMDICHMDTMAAIIADRTPVRCDCL